MPNSLENIVAALYILLPPLLANQRPTNFRINAPSVLPADTVLYTPDVHNIILNIVNQVWDNSIEILINRLSWIITPSDFYTHVPSLQVLQHIRHDCVFTFVWFERTEFLPTCPRHLHHTKYAIVFHISTPIERYRGLALAYMLLRFQEENIRDSGYNVFDLSALSYRFLPFCIHGVMFYDSSFKYAFSHAKSLAFLRSNGFSPFTLYNVPVLRWFATDSIFHGPRTPNPRMIAALTRTVRILKETGSELIISWIAAWLHGYVFLTPSIVTHYGTHIYVLLYCLRSG